MIILIEIINQRYWKLNPLYCRCEEGCRNSAGSYQCGCPEGFQLHLYFNQCVDKDECNSRLNPCGNSKCTNTIGSYECGCPTGYQFDSGLSICIQSGGGCSSAPCAFGCSPTGNQGYSCQCPRGYQSIGDGHCVATVNPSSYQALARDWDFQDMDEGSDDFISTEGCFACQLNGGSKPQRRKGRRRHRRDSNSTVKDEFFDLFSEPNSLTKVHNVRIDLSVQREQTENRKRVLRLQPSRSDLVNTLNIVIVEDRSGELELKRRSGIWGLFFKNRVKTPGNYMVRIQGDPRKGPNFSDKYMNTIVNLTVL